MKPKPKNYSEEFLFATDGQSVYRITNDGDDSEPEKLCKSSLIRVQGAEIKSEVVFTGLEMDDLAKRWLKLRRLK